MHWILSPNLFSNNLLHNYRTDSFTVSGSSTGQNTPPTICGTNTGEHSKFDVLVIDAFTYSCYEYYWNLITKLLMFLFIHRSVCWYGRRWLQHTCFSTRRIWYWCHDTNSYMEHKGNCTLELNFCSMIGDITTYTFKQYQTILVCCLNR